MNAVPVILVLMVIATIADGMVVCQPNLKIIRDCNTCTCNADGSGIKCTKKVCPTRGKYNVPRDAVSGYDTVCKPDAVFEIKDQCSKCTCHSTGSGFGCEDIEGCVEKNPDQGPAFNMADFLPFKLPSV